MKKVFLFFFVFIAIQFFVDVVVNVAWTLISGESLQSMFAEMSGENTLTLNSNLIIVSSAISGILTLFVFHKKRWAVLTSDYLRSKPWNVVTWTVVAALGMMIPSAYLSDIMPELPDLSKDILLTIINNDYGYFVICLFAPLVEEIVFRGAILRVLLTRFSNHWASIIISALLFAVVHMNPAQMPHAFIIGLLLGWLYYRTGSIVPGVIIHFVNNTVSYIVAKLFIHNPDISLLEIYGGNNTHVLLSVAFSFMIFIPAIYQIWRSTSKSANS